MAEKLRKMLGDPHSPQFQTLMRLFETLSKEQIVAWSLSVLESEILPIYELYGADDAGKEAIFFARDYMEKKVTFKEAKSKILKIHQRARELDAFPAGQAAARAIGQGASTIHMPAHALGIAFYGGACKAYFTLSTSASLKEHEKRASDFVKKLEDSLLLIEKARKEDRAKINWRF